MQDEPITAEEPLAQGASAPVHAAAAADSEATPVSPPAPPHRIRRALTLIALVLVGSVASTVSLVGALYAFGTMQSPEPAVLEAYRALYPPGKAPQQAWRFHIQIPGCVCHSPDPQLQLEHSAYYIRDCSRCHGGGAVESGAP